MGDVFDSPAQMAIRSLLRDAALRRAGPPTITAEPGVTMRRVKVVTDYGTYLVCHTWNGTTEGTYALRVAKQAGDTWVYTAGQELVARAPIAGGTGVVDGASHPVIWQVAGAGGGSISAHRCRVHAVAANYLDCRIWDGTTTGASISVAKPFEIQQQTWDGLSRRGVTFAAVDVATRTGTLDSDTSKTDTESIFPAYIADDTETGLGGEDIVAVFFPEGVHVPELDVGETQTRLYWIDVTTRLWMRSCGAP